MSPWLAIPLAALGESLLLCLEVAVIIIPILVGYELLKVFGVFERRWPGVGPAMRLLGLGQGGLIPLLTGLFLGLFYGAGILVSMTQEKALSERERLALATFLVICHSVIEDVALFMLLGGSAVAMLLPRIILAVAITAWLARLRAPRPEGAPPGGQPAGD